MGYEKTFHCFHGTTEEAYNQIVQSGKFTFQTRENHWLGNGVYFFLDDYLKAKWWAKEAVKKELRTDKNKKVLPAVLYIEANVDIDKIIDLNSEKGQLILNQFIEFLFEHGFEFQEKPNEKLSKQQQEHYFRCAVMDLLVESEGYTASCYLFPNNEKPYIFESLKEYGIMNNKGHQLCVYDQSILDFDKLKHITDVE